MTAVPLKFIGAYGSEEITGSTENRSLNFYDELHDVIKQVQDRYYKLGSGIADLDYYDRNNFKNFMANMTVNLNTAKDVYSKIIKNAVGMCGYNTENYEKHQRIAEWNANITTRLKKIY